MTQTLEAATTTPAPPVAAPQLIVMEDGKPRYARIDYALDTLAENPRPPGGIKLTGFEHFWRIRVGNWPITYSIHDDQLLFLGVEIEPGGGAYHNL